MSLKLSTAERLLASDPRLRPLYDEGYELSFEHRATGLQIAINRKSTVKAIRIWIENTIDPHTLGLSRTAVIKHYPPSKARAHLSAPRLTGPYRGRRGRIAGTSPSTTKPICERSSQPISSEEISLASLVPRRFTRTARRPNPSVNRTRRCAARGVAGILPARRLSSTLGVRLQILDGPSAT